MSRSRPEQQVAEALPIFGKDFPVGRKVDECKLAKISVVDKLWKEIPYQQIRLSFVRQGIWITKFITILPEQAYESKEKYDNARTQAWMCIENLMSCYLSSSHMKHVLMNTATHGIRKTMEIIEHALRDKRFWETPVCLKTVPESNGAVSVARFAPFMVNQEGPTNYTLSYSPWEMKKYNKWLQTKNRK